MVKFILLDEQSPETEIVLCILRQSLSQARQMSRCHFLRVSEHLVSGPVSRASLRELVLATE